MDGEFGAERVQSIVSGDFFSGLSFLIIEPLSILMSSVRWDLSMES